MSHGTKSYNPISPEQFDDLEYLKNKKNKRLQDLRPVAVSLVDSFDINDQSLLSTLGSYDGQVYKRMFEAALKSPLNKSDVPDAYHKYIKPMMKSSLWKGHCQTTVLDFQGMHFISVLN